MLIANYEDIFKGHVKLKNFQSKLHVDENIEPIAKIYVAILITIYKRLVYGSDPQIPGKFNFGIIGNEKSHSRELPLPGMSFEIFFFFLKPENF